MKIIFFGGGKFAVPALLALQENFEVVLVVTNPEKPVGRQKIVFPSAVEEKARELKLPVRIVEKFDDPTIKEIQNQDADIFVVVDYGKIIPDAVIKIPKLGTINVHPSALPKYRGASPLQSAILAGEKETAITVMLIDDEMDHGPILTQKTVKIEPDDTYGSLYGRLSLEYPELLVKTMRQYVSGEIKPQEQNHSQATFTKLLKRSDGKIDWNKSADQILNMIRAYDPWPDTFTIWQNKNLKIFEAEKTLKKLPAGKVEIEEDDLLIGTGDLALKILSLQLEGKQKMTAAVFLNGNHSINDAQLN